MTRRKAARAEAASALERVAGEEERFELVYDIERKAPACVLLQAVFGCGTSPRALRCFHPTVWLTAPTPGMQKVSGTMNEWRQLAQIKPVNPPK